ncbi:HAMP domain-containing histidine kinase [Herbidospora galbida]|uniref:histidine kinase n=1 Tax=Herbidospora galbida TaxID=2575442 RepID=A0A4U3MBL0_9ACTN|nr:HAMP domain-containing sensor histidine kinase [Herbidospora galbida]TKK85097.1 HAMP domain-containing histidine kinase [Herbidospora galbida]
MRRVPLWARLVAGTLVLVTLAITLTGVFAVRLLRGYLVGRIDQQLTAAGAPLRELNLKPLLQLPKSRPQRLPGLFHVLILDADGKVADQIATSTAAEEPALTGLNHAKVAALAGHPFTVESADGTGPAWRAVAVPTPDGRSRVVAVSMGDIEHTVARLTVIVAGAGAGVLVALGLACYWLVRRSLRPLGEIEHTAAAIAGGDLSQRVPEQPRSTEMGRLGGAINGMLHQIELAFRHREQSETAARRSAAEARGSEERMRRFVADASHELRTPLTSIRGFAELYRQEADPDTEKLMARIEGEASRMGVLVDDLLLLARLDQQRPLEREPVDVLSLAAGEVLDARLLAPEREIDLVRLDGSDDPLTIVGDEARLRQVLGNLVGNVLKHTPEGTGFTVAVGSEGTGVVIEVADEGPGLRYPERVFERFYRDDPSRSRGARKGGAGLGLSIAAALVEAHGGRICAANGKKGAVFRVELPKNHGGDPPARLH